MAGGKPTGSEMVDSVSPVSCVVSGAVVSLSGSVVVVGVVVVVAAVVGASWSWWRPVVVGAAVVVVVQSFGAIAPCGAPASAEALGAAAKRQAAIARGVSHAPSAAVCTSSPLHFRHRR